MKNFRRVLALAAALTITLALSGCGKMTAGKLVVRTAAALAEKPMAGQTMELDLELSVGAGGLSLDMGMDLTARMLMAFDPSRAYLDAVVSMEVLGRDISETMQIYAQSDGDTLTTYTHTDTGNFWKKATAALPDGEDGGNLDWLKAKPVEELTLAEETETVDGHETYALRCTVSGEELQKLLSAMGTAAQAEGVDLAALEVPAVFYIDTATFLPVRMELEIRGMEELAAGLVDQLLGDSLFSLDLELEVGDVTVVFKDIGYDPVEVPQVPQEALDSTV